MNQGGLQADTWEDSLFCWIGISRRLNAAAATNLCTPQPHVHYFHLCYLYEPKNLRRELLVFCFWLESMCMASTAASSQVFVSFCILQDIWEQGFWIPAFSQIWLFFDPGIFLHSGWKVCVWRPPRPMHSFHWRRRSTRTAGLSRARRLRALCFQFAHRFMVGFISKYASIDTTYRL